jgi:hypothetical protein
VLLLIQLGLEINKSFQDFLECARIFLVARLFVWKKGVGLVEHSSGYGAMKDGFRLKRKI